ELRVLVPSRLNHVRVTVADRTHLCGEPWHRRMGHRDGFFFHVVSTHRAESADPKRALISSVAGVGASGDSVAQRRLLEVDGDDMEEFVAIAWHTQEDRKSTRLN